MDTVALQPCWIWEVPVGSMLIATDRLAVGILESRHTFQLFLPPTIGNLQNGRSCEMVDPASVLGGLAGTSQLAEQVGKILGGIIDIYKRYMDPRENQDRLEEVDQVKIMQLQRFLDFQTWLIYLA